MNENAKAILNTIATYVEGFDSPAEAVEDLAQVLEPDDAALIVNLIGSAIGGNA